MWPAMRRNKKSAGESPAPTQANLNLRARQHRLDSVDRMPRSRRLQLAIDVIDVLHPFGLKPRAERRRPVLGVNRDAVLPSRASAQHAVELHSGFARQFQRLAEFRIAD